MQFVTPLAQSKSSALMRVQDLVARGYTSYTSGTVSLEKMRNLIRKLHHQYAIGAKPALRMRRKLQGQANALLVLYSRHGDERVQWLLLATPGKGLENEHMQNVMIKRLHWLDYELVRYAKQGRTCWTWRREKTEQANFYIALDSVLKKHQLGYVEKVLQMAAHQPGFHGVRAQNKLLFSHACAHGYTGPLPTLFYLQKVSHGERLHID